MNHFRDEEFVDLVLNKIDGLKADAMRSHFVDCADCSEKVKEWEQILLTNNEHLEPAHSFKRRLSAVVKKRDSKRKFYFPGIVLASCVLVFVVSFILSPLNNTITDAAYVHQNYNQTAQHVMNNPDAEKFHIIQVQNQQNIVGDVWVDKVTNEMFMQVEGITPINQMDYQAWILHTNNTMDSEVLRIQDGKVFLYYKGPKNKKIKLIRVSIEPSGGSKRPTGPDAIKVRFD